MSSRGLVHLELDISMMDNPMSLLAAAQGLAYVGHQENPVETPCQEWDENVVNTLEGLRGVDSQVVKN